jgi:hypothetical protein
MTLLIMRAIPEIPPVTRLNGKRKIDVPKERINVHNTTRPRFFISVRGSYLSFFIKPHNYSNIGSTAFAIRFATSS